MAINSTDGISSSSSSLGLLDDAASVSTISQQAAATSTQSTTDSSGDGSSVIDQVDMSATQAIQQMLDPSSTSSATIAKFQALIASGQYKPSGDAIAKSLLQEISTEIYFNQSSDSASTASSSTASSLVGLSSSSSSASAAQVGTAANAANIYLNPDGTSTDNAEGLSQDQDAVMQILSSDE